MLDLTTVFSQNQKRAIIISGGCSETWGNYQQFDLKVRLPSELLYRFCEFRVLFHSWITWLGGIYVKFYESSTNVKGYNLRYADSYTVDESISLWCRSLVDVCESHIGCHWERQTGVDADCNCLWWFSLQIECVRLTLLKVWWESRMYFLSQVLSNEIHTGMIPDEYLCVCSIKTIFWNI